MEPLFPVRERAAMAEGEADRPDDSKVTKNGHSAGSNAVENGVDDESSFSDEEGFVDNVSDAGKWSEPTHSPRGLMCALTGRAAGRPAAHGAA